MIDLHGRAGVSAAPELDCPPGVRVGQRARRDLAPGVFDGALQVAGEDGVARGRGPAPVGRPAAEVPLPVIAARPRLRRGYRVRRVEPGLPDGGVGAPGTGRGLRVRLRPGIGLRVGLRRRRHSGVRLRRRVLMASESGEQVGDGLRVRAPLRLVGRLRQVARGRRVSDAHLVGDDVPCAGRHQYDDADADQQPDDHAVKELAPGASLASLARHVTPPAGRRARARSRGAS